MHHASTGSSLAAALGASALVALSGACGDDGSADTFAAAGGDSGGSGGDAVGSFGDDGGFGQATPAALFFDPPTATLAVDGLNSQTAIFALKAKMQSGEVVSVSAQALQFDRPDLAKMAAGEPVVLTAPGQYGGVGTLHGIYAGLEATAQLEVQVHVREVGPGVDPNAVSALDASGLPQDPGVSSLVYPYDATVFPLGMTSPLVMWNAPAAGDTYRIHYEEKDYVYDAYRVVQAPAQERAAQDAWDRVTASNQGDSLKVTLSRWDGAKQKAYVSAHQAWRVAPASLRGAIYYWTTSSGGHMSRIRPGTGAQPEVLNGGKCMGCHAVSADGSTLVAAVEGAGTTSGSPPGPKQSSDVADGRPWVAFDLPKVTVATTATAFAGNVAVNPDGKYVVFGDQRLYLAEVKTGQYVSNTGLDDFALDPGMSGLMTPAFSADGKHLVAVEGAGGWYHDLYGGKLVSFDFDEATRKFSNPKPLAATSFFPSGERGIAYPTFSPDAKWIAFHVADYDTGCDAQGCGPSSTQVGAIWLQSTGGAPPVRMNALTDSSPNAADHDLSLEPTFNPIERGGYFWVVFSSMRDWGNRITGTPDSGKKRLWVAAIDGAPASKDASHPAFFLEGQEEATENMRGFWALAACTPTQGGGGCKAGFECCSGFCDKGQCVDKGSVACKSVGDACVQDSDCCNSQYVHCTGGICQTPTR